MPSLSAARYGKDNVRVCKVERDASTGVQTVTELTVTVLLEGDIDTSFTAADNSVVVPTDTMKQTTYILAKQHPVNPPELFAATLATHFLDTYAHIHRASVTVKQHRWTRMTVADKPHPHSFLRDGSETRNVEVVAVEKGKGADPSDGPIISIKSAIAGLLLLKTTGSAFKDFVQDEYTVLKPTDDRLFSTEVDAAWAWKPFAKLEDVAARAAAAAGGEGGGENGFDGAWARIRRTTLETFATDSSASVQNTMHKMCERILEAEPEIESVDYSLPNKHYFEIDLSWHKGLQNTGKNAEVYAPQTDPNGLIQCTVSRS